MFKRIILLVPALSLSACLVVIGDTDEDGDFRFGHDNPVEHSQSLRKGANYALSNRIEDALYADEQLMNADLSVSNEGQNIILHGELFDSADLQRAIDIALSDPEVSSVSSRVVLNISR